MPAAPARAGVGPHDVDQAADPDAPDEGAHLALAAVPPGVPPQGQERVLQGLVDRVGGRAPALHADQQPAGVPVIQAGQGCLVAAAAARSRLASSGPAGSGPAA
jgi:hypothetical protein